MHHRSLNVLAPACLLVAVSWAAAGEQPGVARYRTGTPDPRIGRVPAEIQRGVFAEPGRYLEPLVKSLLAGVDDRFHRVKILHDWVAENVDYDVESFLSGNNVEATYENTLRRRKGVCYGYARLMTRMCEAASIPCKEITGFGRGYRYAQGGTGDARQTNHAWNAVGIGGRWYLVDVTWDAGHVEGRSYRKSYGTAYLFLDPREFLYTHLPADPKWQLLDPPMTAEQFDRLPYLRGRFFEHGLRLRTRLGRISRAGASVQIALDVPPETVVSAQLKSSDGAELPRRTLVQREGTRCKILATFPAAGRWKLYLFSKPDRNRGSLSLAATLDFDATEGTARTFPKVYGSYGRLGACLFSPLYVPLSTDGPTAFQIRVPGTSEASLVIGNQPWLPLTRSRTDRHVFQLTTQIPPGESVSLTAKRPVEGGSYWTLVDFSPKQD